jgi:hypothetical protein
MQSLNLYQYFRTKNNHSPLLFNSVLWSLLFITLLVIFTKGKAPIKVDFAYTGIFTLFLTLPVLLNFYVLMPRFLKKERYILYLMTLLGNWILFSIVIQMGLQPVLDALFANLFFISYPTGIHIYITTSVVLAATTLLKLAEDWFYYNTNENRILKLKNTQVETQLSALRAQINPHFLFNSLNVVYSLALEKSDKITGSILQLSDILRYVLYENNVDRVPLKREVKLLKQYIAFQELRNRDQGEVDLLIEVEDPNFKIYPMLLLPLLENAYKHGDMSENKTSGFISIQLRQHGNSCSFSLINSVSNKKVASTTESSGIGLDNIKSNLELVYPGAHEFSTENTEQGFTVKLSLFEAS